MGLILVITNNTDDKDENAFNENQGSPSSFCSADQHLETYNANKSVQEHTEGKTQKLTLNYALGDGVAILSL